MHQADEGLEAAMFCGVLLAGLALNILFSRALRRRMADGTIGRFASTLVQGVAFVPLALAPWLIAVAVRFVAARFGTAIFVRAGGGDDGALIGIEVIGMMLPFVTAALLAVVRLVRGESGGPNPPRPSAPAPRPSTGSRDLFADLPPSSPHRRAETPPRSGGAHA